MRSPNAKLTVEKMVETCCRFGFPRVLISDNGSNFASKKFKDVCKTFRINQKFCPPFWPQANPTERQNRNIKNYLQKYCKEHTTWAENINMLAYMLRINCVESTTYTPAEIIFGRNLNNPFDIPLGTTRSATETDRVNYYKSLVNDLEFKYLKCRDAMHQLRVQSRKYYDHFRRFKEYQVGDLVLMRTHQLSSAAKREAASLHRRWAGPFRVLFRESESLYRIGSVRTGEQHAKVHVEQLKPYHERFEGQAVANAPVVNRRRIVN
jgi:Integrase core domain